MMQTANARQIPPAQSSGCELVKPAAISGRQRAPSQLDRRPSPYPQLSVEELDVRFRLGRYVALHTHMVMKDLSQRLIPEAVTTLHPTFFVKLPPGEEVYATLDHRARAARCLQPPGAARSASFLPRRVLVCSPSASARDRLPCRHAPSS